MLHESQVGYELGLRQIQKNAVNFDNVEDKRSALLINHAYRTEVIDNRDDAIKRTRHNEEQPEEPKFKRRR